MTSRERLLKALTGAAHAAKHRDAQAELWIRVAELYADEQLDIPAGLAALRRVTQTEAGNVAALLKQADLYARDSQWQNAADCLTQVLSGSPSTNVKVKASLQPASPSASEIPQARERWLATPRTRAVLPDRSIVRTLRLLAFSCSRSILVAGLSLGVTPKFTDRKSNVKRL